MVLRPNKRAQTVDLVFYAAIAMVGAVINSALISGILTGSFNIGFMVELFFVTVLPIIGYGVSTTVSMGPEIPIWAWFIIVIPWYNAFNLYLNVIAHMYGDLTQRKLNKKFIIVAFNFSWLFFVGVIGFVIGYTNSLAVENTIGFILLTHNPLLFVVPLLSGVSAFTFSTPIWIAILILWAIWIVCGFTVGAVVNS